jgi:hypothetical protein
MIIYALFTRSEWLPRIIYLQILIPIHVSGMLLTLADMRESSYPFSTRYFRMLDPIEAVELAPLLP